MKTKSSEKRFKVVPVKVKCKGDSLWGEAKQQVCQPKTGEFGYCSWKPGKVELESLFISLSLFGPGFVLAHYTDSGIPKGLLKSRAFCNQVRSEAFKLLKQRGVEETIPQVMSLDWSEQGLQPEGGWNFDVTFKHED